MKSALDLARKLILGIGHSLRHNWGYKVLALGIAILLWALVMAEANPMRSRALSDVPIRLENLAQLQEAGYTLNQPSDAQYLAQVRLEVPRQDVERLTSANVTLRVDLSQLTGAGEHTVPVIATTNLGTVIRVNPSQLTLEVDTWASRTVPVEVVPEGDADAGFWLGTPTVNPSVILVQGPEAEVEKVSKVRVVLPVAGLTQDYSGTHDIVLLDDQDQAVDDAALTLSQSNIIVKMQVRPTKRVPVRALAAVTGVIDLPAGYEVARVEVYPEQVTVAAVQSTLNGLEGIDIGIIDISGATADVSVTAALRPPDGVRILSQASVNVIVRIREIQTELTYENMTVTVRNLPDGLKMEDFEDRVTVTLTGPQRTAAQLSPSRVHVYIDCMNLEAGSYSVRVHVELDDAFSDWTAVPSASAVDVRLTVG